LLEEKDKKRSKNEFCVEKIYIFAVNYSYCTVMEVVRKIVNADLLSSFIDLPWARRGMQVELIVIPQVEKTSRQREVSVKSLKGCLKEYANPALWEKEQHAWEDNILEKYGHI